jgi:hypothetical protein
VCGARENGEKQRCDHAEIVERITKIHGGTITVLSQYSKGKDKLTVACQCGHRWSAQASSLLQGYGCPDCFRIRIGDRFRFTHTEAVARIKKNFGNKIEVLGQYQKSTARIQVRCQCGHQWAPTASSLFEGAGCPQCAILENAKKRALTQDEFVARVNSNFAGKITVLGQYKNAFTRISVQCRCGHKWSPLAMSPLAGSGCAKCAEYGFRPDKPAIAYYVRFDFSFGSLYKPGVTHRTVAERFQGHKVKPETIETWSFKTGAEALAKEQSILNDYAQYRYRGPDIMLDGNDELFACDVLGLDRGDQLLLAV